jgi:hypothetical protein
VFNKEDLLTDPEEFSPEQFRQGIRITATDARSLMPLIRKLETLVSGMVFRE